MADSQSFRKKFFVGNILFLCICVVILLLLYPLSGALSRHKVDLTADKVYTVSEPTKNILSELIDQVKVDYYVSGKELPSFFKTVVRDTRDMFEEFSEISGGKLVFEIRDPDAEAANYAREKVDAYYEAKEAGKTPEEPEPVQTIQDIFSQRQPPTAEEIRKQREEAAQKLAARQGREQGDVEREILGRQFEEQYKQKLEEEQIFPIPLQESTAGEFRQVRAYTAIKISYLDKQPEVIPVHHRLETLEYELASRILKLTREQKPVVAVFDGRKPPAPPMNPMQPQRPPPSDYEAVWNHLREFFDLREVAIKEADSIEDLVRKLKEDKWERENERADDAAKEQALAGGVQPADYALLSCLVIAQPDQLEPRQVFEINRAISLGVSTIFLASRFGLDYSQQGMQQGVPIATFGPGSDFDDLLKSWGIELPHQALASNERGTIRLLQRIGPMTIPGAVPAAACVLARRDHLESSHSMLNGVNELVFPMATGVAVTDSIFEKLGFTSEVLARSSDQSWTATINPFANAQNPLNRGAPPSLVSEQKDLIHEKPDTFPDFVDSRKLAILVQGKFPFKYQGQPAPEWREEPDAGAPGGMNPHGGMPGGFPGMPGGFPGMPGGGDGVLDAVDPDDLALLQESNAGAGDTATDAGADSGDSSAGGGDAAAADDASDEEAKPVPVKVEITPVDGRLLLVSSADMMKTGYINGSGSQGNLTFLINAVEVFGADERLLTIRRKQLTQRFFKPGAENSYQSIIFFNFLVPVLVAVFGIVVFLVRRSRSIGYERRYIEQHQARGA